ncbi:MAG TPA: hypothetical protein VLE22_25025 [Bryobacteraceae bacterium]|nr:hypothetical protein [Bryobacteraceae bacterium]
MKRRAFFRTAGLAIPIAVKPSAAYVVSHNWDKYDFGSGPPVKERLYQGPFPQYPPEQIFPGGDVVMATTPSDEVVPNFGRGLITYIAADMGTAEILGEDKAKAIEELVKLPLGQKLYIRPTWREVQPRRGRLEFPDYWKLTFDLAKQYNKQVGFRIQMRAPDYPEEALPDFVLEKVPMVKLEGQWRRNSKREFQEPRYDHPAFQEAFQELNGLLAAELNGNPLVEFVDTFMYGFWGEGHTWPFRNNPFPNYQTAERTWAGMFEKQLEQWTKTPLATNTQPDFSLVGNSELVDRTVRSYNWLRTDTIFIENVQIEAIGNRPPWVAAVLEVGMSDGSPNSLRISEGVPATDNMIQHVLDVGANYWSLWNFHRISAEGILNYYRQYPKKIDEINRSIGYNVRPSFVWVYEGDNPGLIIGFANDGVAGVPGVLRVTVFGEDGKAYASGGLDAGYPLPGKIRQAQFPLPKGTKWEGLQLKAELEVKGVRHPVRWACHQKTNPDGSLTLRRNLGRG